MFKSIENLIKLTFLGVICLMGPLGQTGSVGILRIDQGLGPGSFWLNIMIWFFTNIRMLCYQVIHIINVFFFDADNVFRCSQKSHKDFLI